MDTIKDAAKHVKGMLTRERARLKRAKKEDVKLKLKHRIDTIKDVVDMLNDEIELQSDDDEDTEEEATQEQQDAELAIEKKFIEKDDRGWFTHELVKKEDGELKKMRAAGIAAEFIKNEAFYNAAKEFLAQQEESTEE